MVNGDHSSAKVKKNPASLSLSDASSSTNIEPSARSSGLYPPASSQDLRSRMISPRSSNYERLEGGHGPSRISKKFAWKKFALAAVVIIAIVFFFGPRAHRMPWKSQTKDSHTRPSIPYDDDVEVDPLPGPPDPEPHKNVDPPKHDTKPPAHSDAQHPDSFETDPDPTKTTHCTKPYHAHSPLVQYALMIDAGSTGSRIHIYKFNNCGPSAEYEYEVFKMIRPGLSSFAGKPEEAARSLDVLLDEAVRVVPVSLRSCTPVAVKATAGLRLLKGSQSSDILHAIRDRLHNSYPFRLQDKDGVVIMDGKDEGVYAWITANYLLNTIKADTPKDTPTYAVLDLGGASTQIVFEPAFSASGKGLEPGEHKYELKFGGNTHTLYQHSYLGYGLMRARQHVHNLVEFMASIRATGPSHKEKQSNIIGNPCIARNMRRTVVITDEVTKETRKVTMDGDDIGSFEACDRIIQLVLAKDAICELKPCSFNGVYQPSLLDSFPHGKVLLLSYFYDRLFPLITHEKSFTVSNFASMARDVCKGKDHWLTKPWGKNSELMDELEGRPEWCLDLTFMHALLRLGYEFQDNREIRIEKKIRDTELGWCLGATIAMVGGELSCRD